MDHKTDPISGRLTELFIAGIYILFKQKKMIFFAQNVKGQTILRLNKLWLTYY